MLLALPTSKNPGDVNIIEQLNQINADQQKSYRNQGIKSEECAIAQIKENPSYFFKYVNSKRKAKSRVGPLKSTHQGKPCYESDPLRMAEILSKQYESVFTVPRQTSRCST